jgi:hypothetical protein
LIVGFDEGDGKGDREGERAGFGDAGCGCFAVGRAVGVWLTVTGGGV